MEDNVKVLQVDTSQAQSNVDKLAKSVNEVSNKLNTGFTTAAKGMETFSQATGKASASTQALQKSLGGMGGSLKGLQDMMPFLQSGLGAAASSMAALTKQALAFIATPIGAVIAAVGLAVKQLIDAFKRNEEAMASLKKLMAPFQALWQSIQRVFDEVVKSLVGVMDKLNGANGSTNILSKSLTGLKVVLGIITGSFKIVERNVSAVFNVIGKLTTAAKNFAEKTPLKGFLQDLGGVFEKVRGAVVKFVNTVANSKLGKLLGWDIITDEIKNAVKATDELTESNQKIADLENEIAKTKRKNTEEIAENERKISELREKASDKEKYNAEERKKFIEEAGNLEADNLEKTKNLRQKEYDLIKLKNSLTASGTKDLEAESNALAALTKAETDYNNNKRNLNKQLNALNKEVAADLDKRLQQQKDYLIELQDLERQRNEILAGTLKPTENKSPYEQSSVTGFFEDEEEDEDYFTLTDQYFKYLDAKKEADLTYLESLKANKDEEINFIDELEKKGIIDHQRALDLQNEANKEYAKKSAQYQIQAATTVASGLADILNSIASMQDENDKEGFERSKNLQVAAATINMLSGITAALSGLFTTKSGPWDIVLAATQAATIAASGIANIVKIKNTKFDGNNSSSASASVPSASAIGATIMQPTQYTQAVQGAQIEDKIGDTKVYVTETDISNTMKKVSVQETENRY